MFKKYDTYTVYNKSKIKLRSQKGNFVLSKMNEMFEILDKL